MYLSDRDIRWAVERGLLTIDPPPDDWSTLDATALDLRLDNVDEAKIWDIEKYAADNGIQGTTEPELRLGTFKYQEFAIKYLRTPPEQDDDDPSPRVVRSGRNVIVRPGGFLLWQTRERIGTPKPNAQFVCFVNGKSTRARMGIIVHLTAPTIHGNWAGNVTLEIANMGPFSFVLKEGDVIAQLTVATISSAPIKDPDATGSSTYGQKAVGGAVLAPPPPPRQQ